MEYVYCVQLVIVIQVTHSSCPSMNREHGLVFMCVQMIQLENCWTDLDKILCVFCAIGDYSKITLLT
jgi:hypothetical protein